MAARRRKRQHTGKSGSRPAGQAPGWAWLLIGLSIGLAVALVVYLKSGQPPLPASPATQSAARSSEAAPVSATSGGAPDTAPDRSDDAGAAPADAEFSFFRELPESEVVIPESEFRAREQAGPAPEYIIQAGSFRAFADADSMQARLAFLGIESKIESAIVGNLLYHRVIIGPLGSREEINTTVRRLNAARIESLPPRPISR